MPHVAMWACNVCSSEYFDKEDAATCETYGVPEATYSVGTRFGPNGEWTVRSVDIRRYRVPSSKPGSGGPVDGHTTAYTLIQGTPGKGPFDLLHLGEEAIRRRFGQPYTFG